MLRVDPKTMSSRGRSKCAVTSVRWLACGPPLHMTLFSRPSWERRSVSPSDLRSRCEGSVVQLQVVHDVQYKRSG